MSDSTVDRGGVLLREQTQKENELNAIASLLSDRSEAGVYAKVDGLLAEQTRLREALKAASKELWATYSDTPRLRPLFVQIDAALDGAALSSTPTPEHTK